MYKPVVKANSYFISGKFNQYQQNTPYSAIISAFEELVEQLLTGTEIELDKWREKILNELEANITVITDLIPKFKLIINKTSKIPVLSGEELENRFNIVFQKFVTIFAKSSHPLVIFLDDLQWADGASLRLIELIMTRTKNIHLLLIGSYRDNISLIHPLISTINKIESAEVIVDKIFLSTLKVLDIKTLIADSFNCSLDKTQLLAELVLAKTNGNPFFINQFLRSLYEQNILYFDKDSLSWKWDLKPIKAETITENVIFSLSESIKKIQPKVQEILQIAACMGNYFDVENLALVSKIDFQETTLLLKEAARTGLIFPFNKSCDFIPFNPLYHLDKTIIQYEFIHDQVRESIYSSISSRQKSFLHWTIGQILLQNTSNKQIKQEIFKIVNHLNLGIELITNLSEKDKIAELNLIAGKKAKKSAAYKAAYNYLILAINILGKNSWERQYELTLSLYTEAADAAFVNGNFNLVNRWTEEVFQKGKNLLDQVNCYEIKIKAYNKQNKLIDALDIGRLVLNMLEIKLPKYPRRIGIFLEMLTVDFLFTTKLSKKIKDLVYLPENTDPYRIAAIRILSVVLETTHSINPNLSLLIILKSMKLLLKYGNNSISIRTYACYGLVLVGIKGDINSAYEFARVSLILLKRFKLKEQEASIIQAVYGHVMHWKEPLNQIIPFFLDGYNIGIETGSLEYAACNAVHYIGNSFFIGKELLSSYEETRYFKERVGQFFSKRTVHYIQLWQQVILNLLKIKDDPGLLFGEAYDENNMLEFYQSINDKTAIFILYAHKLILYYLFEDPVKAVESANIARTSSDGVIGYSIIPVFNFYDSLAKIALFISKKSWEQKQILKQVSENQKRMKKWAHYAPMNYQHKYDLVAAELDRVKGDKEKAIDLYESAIALARKHEYLNEEALAYELTAKFYLEWGKITIAKTYMIEARYRYQLWGATAKVKQLEKKYPELLSSGKSRRSDSDNTVAISRKGTSRIKLDTLDLATILETDRTISEEEDLEKLLAIVLDFAKKNVGAQIGLIIPVVSDHNKNNLVKIAKINENDEVEYLAFDEAEKNKEFPQKIADNVKRDQEPIILGNALAEGLYITDPYIADHKVKSVLCFPLISQRKCVGVIYLENNLSINVFKKDSLPVLRAIVNRGAEAIEIAILRRTKTYTSRYYKVGGSLQVDAPTYIYREADEQLYQNLMEGNYCYVLNARQMGKSSLRVRMTSKLKEQGIMCSSVDITTIGSKNSTLEQWYLFLIKRLVQSLRWKDFDYRAWWNSLNYMSAEQRFYEFVDEILLERISQKLVIFLDEIDSVQKLNFATDYFFVMLRSFYSARVDYQKFNRLCFVFLGVASPFDLLRGEEHREDGFFNTPFNVGTAIALKPFQRHEIKPLAEGLREKHDNPEALLEQVLDWTGGQPFLTQKLCSLIACSEHSSFENKEAEWIEQFINEKIIYNWEVKDEPAHLKTIHNYILSRKSPQTLALYQEILRHGSIAADVSLNHKELILSGLVYEEDKKLKIYNRIYKTIFNLDWVEKALKNWNSTKKNQKA